MESSSRLPSTDNEKRNGFGSYLEQISRGDSPKAVNGASSRGDSRSVRSQGNPSGWNATGLSDPDSWDPRDFDPLTQSLSGRALSQPSDPASDKRQTVARSAPPAGVSAQSRPNVGPPSPISQSQPSQNRPSPVQRAPPNSRRPQGRDATDQSVMRVNQSDRKPAWTPQSNNAPYTNPSTLMPTDVAQLSQPPLQGEPVQRRQERTQPERPLVAQPDKKATWTPPSNNAPYTNPSTLMPTDVTPVDGDSYLGSLSSSSPSTRPRGSYNPFGRPVVANVRNSPTSETTVSRQRTDTSIAPRTANTQQTPPFGATRNQGPPSARSDARAQSEVVTQITPERVASRGREQADRVVPVRRTESPSAPAVLSRPIEPARAETPPQRPIITPPRPQSPLVPADLIRPVKPDITSVTRATSGRSDTANESRAQPSSMQRSNNANSRFPDTVQNSQPRNGFFPQQSSQATEQRNGQVNGENLSRSRGNVDSREVPLVSSDTSRVDSNVGPDQPRTNRTPWISSGSSNDQSDYNPRNFDPRTQTFRETLGPNSRARQNGQGQ